MKKLLLATLATALLVLVPVLSAQTVSGNISVTVVDKSGAVVPKASVTAVNRATGLTKTGTANEQGEFLFTDLPPGNYDISGTAPGLSKATVTDFPVHLNRTESVLLTLGVAAQNVTVEISSSAPPINTSTPQIEGTFESKETSDLPSATITPGGVLNLALLQPGVSTSGGVGYGSGPTVGGQRPTNNNFTIEGVDNNDKSVTGPLVTVPNDAVAEFSALQNQYSPEFGHSNGGQFNTVVQSGTNNFHGKLYEYFENRNLNAIDNQVALNTPAGQSPSNPRFDFNRVGGQLGGPILKDKLFFFANGEYDPFGASGTPVPSCAPTAAGYTALAALPAGPVPNGTGATATISATNLGVLQNFLPTASASGTCGATQGNAAAGVVTNPLYLCTGGSIPNGSTAGGVTSFTCPSGALTPIDVGALNFVAPNFTNTYFLTTAGDYNMSSKDQLRVRYIYNRLTGIDINAQLPVFFTPAPARFHLVALNEYHTFTPTLTNELRLGYNRFQSAAISGNFTFPGLDQFPNLVLNDLGLQLGPDPNAPSTTVQNTYQISENLSWTHKNHNVRTGVEVRRYIAPGSFTQRARGDYNYSSLGSYLYDLNPDGLTERSTGSLIYYGDLVDSAWYINDQWRIRPSISLNFGMRYEYASIPQGERLQPLNKAASVPGLIDYSEPRAPKNQFMPRVGFAWTPDKNQTWSIRGGWSMGYDVNYDNLGTNAITAGGVPQLGATIDQDQVTCATAGSACAIQFGNPPAGILTNYFANGAIPPGTGGFNTFPDVATQQENTAGHVVVNNINPVAITYTLGVQHQFAKNYTAEVRYVGTHGYHLPVQLRINRQQEISSTLFLPTFLANPGAAVLNSLTTTIAALNAVGSFVPAYIAGCGTTAGPCFASSVTEFNPSGNSVYNGLSGQLTRRFEHGLQFSLAYTWSHAIDDSTATLASTTFTPRRPQDFQDLADDRSNSALDHRHRVVLAIYYDLPYFKTGSWARRNLLGNWLFAPVYTYQSGAWADLQANSDVNRNGDAAGDRVLINPAGTSGTSTTVTPLMATAGPNAGQVVAYQVVDPNAFYIRPGSGSLEPNNGLVVAGRNTILTPAINNIDFTIGKKFSITEKLRFEFQTQFLNLFNHPQYIAGSLNQINPILTYKPGTSSGLAITNALTPGNPAFGRWDQVLSSNPRIIQLTAKLVF